jgi:hypothetical protein
LNLGVRRQRIGTEPEIPSTRRMSSNQGSSEPWSSGIASVTRATPPAVRNVVCSTLLSPTYARSTSNSSVGASSNAPPRSASSNRANTVGESMRGSGSQSTEPSRATSAVVRPSPISA